MSAAETSHHLQGPSTHYPCQQLSQRSQGLQKWDLGKQRGVQSSAGLAQAAPSTALAWQHRKSRSIPPSMGEQIHTAAPECLPFPKGSRAGSFDSMLSCLALEAVAEPCTKEQAQEHPSIPKSSCTGCFPQPKHREFSSEMPQKPARLGAAEAEKRHQRNINTKFAISFAPDRMEPGGTCSFPFNQELS